MKYKCRLIVLLVIILIPFTSKAIVGDYTFSSNLGEYIPLSSETILVSGNINYYLSQSISIPPFKFNDITYTNMYVSGNGFITFGASPPSTDNYNPIWRAENYNAALAALAQDLGGGINSKISYNTNDNGEIVIQWHEMSTYSSSHIVSFQIRLNPSNGLVRFVYGESIINVSGNIGVEVGLRGITNTDFNNRIVSSGWNNTNAGNDKGSTCPINASIYPQTGLTFSFAPPIFVMFKGFSNQPDQIHLEWKANCNCGPYLLAVNTTNNFGSISGSYNIGDEIIGGGSVLYIGNDSIYNHTNIQPNSTYYYRIWYIDSLSYSSSRSCLSKTPCNGVIGLEENFDSGSLNTIPICWTKISIDNTTALGISNMESYSGNNSLYMNNLLDTNCNMLLISPLIGMELNHLQIQFYAKSLSTNQKIMIGSMTDPMDVTSFHPFSEITLTGNFSLFTVSFENYIGFDSFIAIRHQLGGNYRIVFIDDISINEVQPEPIFTVIPSMIDFNQVNVGVSSNAGIITVKNTGSGNLVIKSYYKSGANVSNFIITNYNSFPLQLGSGQTIQFNVVFHPISAGVKNMNLVIIQQDTILISHSIPITGIGSIPPNLSIVYISPGGSGSKDGTSWQNAMAGNDSATNGYSKLAEKIQTSLAGTQIWLKSGIYYSCIDNDRNKSFSPNHAISLYGGFSGSEININQRDTNNYSELSGDIGQINDSSDNTYTLFSLITDVGDKLILDQIKFTKACRTALISSGDIALTRCAFISNYWGFYENPGASCISSSDTIEINNSIFTNNKFQPPPTNQSVSSTGIHITEGYCNLYKVISFNNYSGGYGFIRNNGICKIESSYFHHNYTGFVPNGGGVIVVVSGPTYCSPITNLGSMKINNTVFSYNGSTRAGSIVNYGNILVTNSKIVNQYQSDSRYGAIISCYGGNATFMNCICANNESKSNGSVYTVIQNDGGILTFINSTICNNKTGGYFVRTGQLSLTSFKNCILWGNIGTIKNEYFQVIPSGYIPSNGVTVMENTCIQGGFTGIGNINLNPLFFIPTAGSGNQYPALNSSWKVKACSPCIEAGNNDYCITDHDYENNSRIVNLVDMGAYEVNYENIVSNINANGISRVKMNLQWSMNIIPCNSLVFVKDTNAGSPQLQIDSIFIANSVYSLGTSSNGWYCIYNGSGNSVALTGLLEGTNYRVALLYQLGNAYRLASIKNIRTENITFPNINVNYGVQPFSITNVVASSGITQFSYKIADNSIASIVGNSIIIHNSGSTSISVKHTGNGSYLADSTTAILTVGKAILNFSADNKTKFCGSEIPSLTFTVTGLINDDSLGVLDSLPLLSTNSTQFSPVGTYEIQINGGGDNNYQYHYSQGQLEITNIPIEITTNGVSVFCSNDSILIHANSIDNVIYKWIYNGDTINGQNSNDFFATHGGIYSVIVSIDGICSNSSNIVNINEIPLPNVTVNINGNTGFCQGDSVILQAIQNSSYTYQWHKDGIELLGEVNSGLTVKSSGIYSVSITNELLCLAYSQNIGVTVNPIPTIQIMGLNDSICSNNEPVLLVGNPTGGIFSGTGVISPYLYPSIAGIGYHEIYYSYTDSNFCSNNISYPIEILGVPQINLGNDTLLCENHALLLNSGSGYSQYLWSTGATSQVVTIDSTGTGIGTGIIWVQVKDSEGCYGYDTILVTFTPCSSIGDLTSEENIVIFPNPANKEITFNNQGNESIEEIRIYNLAGSLIYRSSPNLAIEQKMTINIELFNPGFYFLQLRSIGTNSTAKFTIIK